MLRALDVTLIADPLRETVPQVLKRLFVANDLDPSDDALDRLALLIRSTSEALARELSTESLEVLIEVLVALEPAAPTAIAAELLTCLEDVGSSNCDDKASSMPPLLRGLMHVQPAELAKHFDSSRPNVGDVVIVRLAKKKGTIVRDDRDSRPFRVKSCTAWLAPVACSRRTRGAGFRRTEAFIHQAHQAACAPPKCKDQTAMETVHRGLRIDTAMSSSRSKN